MLGSGIFVLPGLAAAKTGTSVWLAYVLAGICVLPAALSKSELATAMPTSGGTYVYLERTLGPLTGTIAGIGLWLSLLLKSSFALVGFGAYLLVFCDIPLLPTSLTLLCGIALVNVAGVGVVGRIQTFVVLISLGGLFLLTSFAWIAGTTQPSASFLTHGTGGLVAATAFVFVSYDGVTKIAAIAEEVKRPDRNLPLGILISLGATTFLYAFIVYFLTKNVPLSTLTTDFKPIHTLAENIGGYGFGIAAAVLGVLTLTSMANAGLLAASRFPFAMSRDKLLPSWLHTVHERYLTPVTCIMVTAIAMALAITFLDVEKLAKLASAFKILVFIAVNVTLIVLRETSVQWYQPGFKSPFYPWTQIFGICTGFILLSMLGFTALYAIGAVFLAGIVLYFAYGRRQVERHGVLKLYGRRALNAWSHGRKLSAVRDSKRKPKKRLSSSLLNIGDLESSEGQVVVPLFGSERSAESLVEIGTGLALAEDEPLHVFSLTEIPEQTILDAEVEDDSRLAAVERRLGAMCEARGIEINLDSIATHDIFGTVRNFGKDERCDWLLLGWQPIQREGFLIKNRVGWLYSGVDCNVARFKDVGTRYIRKILVYPEPDYYAPLLVSTSARLAKMFNAELTFLSITDHDTTPEDRNQAQQRLEVLAGNCGAKTQSLIVVAKEPVVAIEELTPWYDLLIIPAPRPRTLAETLRGTAVDKLIESSDCSVLSLTRKASAQETPQKESFHKDKVSA